MEKLRKTEVCTGGDDTFGAGSIRDAGGSLGSAGSNKDLSVATPVAEDKNTDRWGSFALFGCLLQCFRRRCYLKRGNMGPHQDHSPAKTLVSWLLREMHGVSFVVFGRGDPDDVKTLVLDDSIWEEIIEKAHLTERLHAGVGKVLADGYPCLGLINFPWESNGPQDFEAILPPEIPDPKTAERTLLVCAYEFRRRCIVIPLGRGMTKPTPVFHFGR